MANTNRLSLLIAAGTLVTVPVAAQRVTGDDTKRPQASTEAGCYVHDDAVQKAGREKRRAVHNNPAAHMQRKYKQALAADAAKTTETASRLIGDYYAYYASASSAFVPSDTNRYTWSGSRGVNMEPGSAWYSNDRYDTAWHFGYTGGAYRLEERTAKTFNSENNPLTILNSRYDAATTSWTNGYDENYTYDASGLLVTSYVARNWDAPLSSWVGSDREFTTYTGDKVAEFIDQNWDPGISSFVNNSRERYTYDGSGKETEYIYDFWSTTASAWEGDYKYLYTYDPAGNQLSSTGQRWDAGTSTWINNSRNVNTYDAAGNPLSQTTENWDSPTSSWIPGSRYVYTYNASGDQLTTEYSTWDLATSSWVPVSRITYTYSAGYREELYQTYNSVISTWFNTSQYLITSDAAGNVLSSTHRTWELSTSSWVNSSKYTYAYNAAGYETESLTQHWNTTTSSWDNYSRTFTNHNSFNQVVQSHSESWDMATSAWGNTDGNFQYRYTYETFTAIPHGDAAAAGSLHVYPVPASGTLHVHVRWNEPQPATVALMDVAGRPVGQWPASKSASAHVTVPVQHLPNGTYLLQVRGEKGQVSQTVQVLH